MQGKNLFEYAVIRLVPKVEREEFMNVGVILYCPSKQFLGCQFSVNQDKISSFAPELDVHEILRNLISFKNISSGRPDSGPIGQLDLPSRFRWLSATRSTIIQVSKVHSGFCVDPEICLAKLVKDLVD
jgi:hypothetical protein